MVKQTGAAIALQRKNNNNYASICTSFVKHVGSIANYLINDFFWVTYVGT